MNRLIINLLLILVFFSCSDQKKTKDLSEDFKILSEKVINFRDESKLVKLSEITKESPNFIFLETTENSLIGRIDKIIFYNEFIFILDSFIAEAILIFNKEGKFIKKLSSQGEGPDQYKKPLDFFVENEKIWILDNGREIKVFDIKGDLMDIIKIKSLSAIKFQKSNDSSVFSFVSGDIDDNLIVTDKDLNRINSRFPYINRDVDKVIINPIYKQYDSGEIIYRRNYNDTLYSIDKFGSIRPYKFINYGSNGIDHKTFSSIKSSIMPNDLLDKFAYTTYFSENLKNEYLVFSFKDDYWISVYDKKNETSILFTYENYLNDLTYEKDSYAIGTTKEELIFLVIPQSLKAHEEKIIANANNKFPPEFYQNIKNVSPDDNPILMLVKYVLASTD
ncbi:6-bladed beta-propeller [Aquiflexum sp.]|uniref:6-bladed beta-propeller n=1 Tax=Aquiflexum sp. TaxID=1872584 RepID=UPI0035931BBC